MSTAEKSDFVGGLHWHVPRPDPAISECCRLVNSARAGDKKAIAQCDGIYVKASLKLPRPKKAKTRSKAVKRRR